jgi:serine/threonine protein kinase
VDPAVGNGAGDLAWTPSGRPGVSLGSYDLLRIIGNGGSATVYEAVHRSLGRPVALKVLHAPPAEAPLTEQVLKRFLREGRAAARVRHPHVVDVFDCGEADGIPFLVMELVDGETLAQRLQREMKLPLARVLEILLPILSAVAKVHSAGIVHRDIKPSNILLAAGDEAHAKLSDFGVSRLDDGSPLITQSENVLGTPAYMAPEVVLFSPTAATEASDQYSLAVTLYECVTGERPFRGESTYEIMHSVVSGAVCPPSFLEPTLTKGFDEVVLRAMHREPNARFDSVYQFARALLQVSPTDGARPRGGSVLTGGSARAPDPNAIERESARARGSTRPTRRVLHDDKSLLVAELGRICVVVWRQAVTPPWFELQRSGLEEVVNRHPAGAGFMCVVENGSLPLPSDELRRASTQMVTSHGDRLLCVAAVVEATGFSAALIRSAITGMAFFTQVRSAVPLSVLSSTCDAFKWMAEFLPVDSDGFSRSLDEIRQPALREQMSPGGEGRPTVGTRETALLRADVGAAKGPR